MFTVNLIFEGKMIGSFSNPLLKSTDNSKKVPQITVRRNTDPYKRKTGPYEITSERTLLLVHIARRGGMMLD